MKLYHLRFKIKIKYFILLVAFLLIVYSFIEPYIITIDDIYINSKDIPVSFRNIKIVFVSDIHFGRFFNDNRLESLVDKINRLNADIVIFGGDYVDKKPEYIPTVFSRLKNVTAFYGKYGVLGNHDHWTDADKTLLSMGQAGIISLRNTGKWIYKNGQKIKLIGVGDFWMDSQKIDESLKDVKKDDFVICVSHQPDYFEELDSDKIDLVLSGHNHGGQITFFGLWAPIVPSQYGQKYRTGIIEKKNMKMIVTNGIGMVNLPIRFFAPPEIIVLCFN